MDLDRYLTVNRPDWDRLRHLATRARRQPHRLQPREVDELIRLYQRASTQLSFARNHYQDPSLTAELTAVVADANATIYRRTGSPLAGLRRFFTISFPATVWHLRRFVLASAAALVIPWLVVGLWMASTEEALAYAGTEAERAAYVDEDFEAYYSSAPASEFATQVLINNIQVSFLAYAAGVLFGAGAVFILAFNGANVGVAWALFIVAGQQGRFWGLILPHGLLELSAVVLAGAAGMALGWSLVAPGDRRRGQAFTEEARRSVLVILGLVLVFIAAGIIEAFITPSPLPTAARVAFGIAVEFAFVAYIVSFGRRAAAQGLTGLAGDDLEGPTARAVLNV
ncbi:MAG: stage II sporulation protein M [Actinomycetota bacterium]